MHPGRNRWLDCLAKWLTSSFQLPTWTGPLEGIQWVSRGKQRLPSAAHIPIWQINIVNLNRKLRFKLISFNCYKVTQCWCILSPFLQKAISNKYNRKYACSFKWYFLELRWIEDICLTRPSLCLVMFSLFIACSFIYTLCYFATNAAGAL